MSREKKEYALYPIIPSDILYYGLHILPDENGKFYGKQSGIFARGKDPYRLETARPNAS